MTSHPVPGPAVDLLDAMAAVLIPEAHEAHEAHVLDLLEEGLS